MLRRSVMVSLGCILSFPAAFAQIPPGFELVRITDDPDQDDWSIINKCGQVVYSKRINQDWDMEEIFLYDNGRTARLTFNDVTDRLPDINDESTIIWTHGWPVHTTTIRVLEEGVERDLFLGFQGSINNLGQIAFMRFGRPSCRGPEMDIYFYDGVDVIQITHTDGDAHQSPALNDSGEIAWTRYDFCPEPWVSDIMFYSDGEIVQLTDDRVRPQLPDINNPGAVAWVTKDPDRDNQRFIEIWDGEEIRILVDAGNAPKLTDGADFAYSKSDDPDPVGASVVLDGVTYRIGWPGAITGAQDINEYGETVIALNFGFPNTDMALLRRIRTGDSEFDGDIDHDDLAKLVDCMTGPGWVERTNPGPEDSLCECRFLDINHDGSVDLRDYAIFQQNFGG